MNDILPDLIEQYLKTWNIEWRRIEDSSKTFANKINTRNIPKTWFTFL